MPVAVCTWPLALHMSWFLLVKLSSAAEDPMVGDKAWVGWGLWPFSLGGSMNGAKSLHNEA